MKEELLNEKEKLKSKLIEIVKIEYEELFKDLDEEQKNIFASEKLSREFSDKSKSNLKNGSDNMWMMFLLPLLMPLFGSDNNKENDFFKEIINNFKNNISKNIQPTDLID